MNFFLWKFLSRNKETGRDEFIFYSKRLMRILIEYALSLLPFEVILNLRYFIDIQVILSRMLPLKHHKVVYIKEKNMYTRM